MDTAFFDMLKRQAFEQRSEIMLPEEHRLLSFWQAYYSCAPVRQGGAPKNPNLGRTTPVSYELDAGYWLNALSTETDVANFVALGKTITMTMEEPNQRAMLEFISNLPTDTMKDKEALQSLYTKASELTAAA